MKRTIHAGPTLAIGLMHRILVLAHGRSAPSKEDWMRACEAIGENHDRARGQLVLSLGGAPDAAQRKMAIDRLPPGFVTPPVAVISDALIVRGVITALNWLLNDSHRAFRPTDVDGVAAHLGIPRDRAAELVAFAQGIAPPR